MPQRTQLPCRPLDDRDSRQGCVVGEQGCHFGSNERLRHLLPECAWRLPGEFVKGAREGLRAVIADRQRHLRDALVRAGKETGREGQPNAADGGRYRLADDAGIDAVKMKG